MEQEEQVEQAVASVEPPSLLGVDFISKLPTEMIASICELLDKRSLHNFRMTSKHIHAQSYTSFFAHHFRVSSFTFTRDGLKKLVEFSKDPNIRPEIKVIRLILVAFPKQGKEHLSGLWHTPSEAMAAILAVEDGEYDVTGARIRQIRKYRKNIRRNRRRAYGRYQEDQNLLRRSGDDVNLLAEALRRLPALEEIDTVDIYGVDSPWGRGKIIEDLGEMPFTASMESWIPMKHDTYESRFEVERELKITSAHSVGAVLGAIRCSVIKFNGILELNGVPHSVRFAKWPHCSRLSLSATPARSFSLSMLADMKDTLSGLKALRVSTFSYVDRKYEDDPVEEYDIEWLYQLLERTTGLTSFSMNDNGARSNRTIDLDMMHSMEYRSITFPRLKAFMLLNAECETPVFIRFLEKHKTTLRRVCLDNINFRATTPLHTPDDRDTFLFVRWSERNYWRVIGYQSVSTELMDDYAQLEFRESLRSVICMNEALPVD
ncbi:uncharacterized protein CC84DRAFT_1171814 [Paraphaeosphaeria sporulosa]|uniref:F-box domain-containing protein n=1 Tax=Paraphaeosphaeria sporulosa TaxID=1460663 RepID=A0A177CQI0_9PLEO|nr:uncharacterized protein CC84DRAFT_1171814 [Paraphaeosphaeria sporulosa]OAG09202.1 hypothetical protein CC84DRAFT_1171814 [Paraphaeosphaeria sporulosa]